MEFVGLFLDKGSREPLYQQLYGYLAGEVRGGRLRAGERLPGKRTAAAQLGVSVNTVDAAYGMLAAEGYVRARERSGFVVARLEQLVPPPAGRTHPTMDMATEKGESWRYSLATGDIDPGLFPGKTWNRLLREVLAGEPGLFTLGEPQGDGVLRQAVAAYLRGYRGVRCEADQLVIGAGLEVLAGMLARLFAGETVAVENPGYAKTARVLHNMGAKVLPLPVDENGLRADSLAASGAKLAYLTPSHQFPTGAVMPVGRRAELLGWARESGGLLIEDDYDSEFRFDGRPLPSLQGLDEGGSVVYAGTFSRSLAPGLRAAYLVLPPGLLARWREHYGGYACTVWRPEQHTLARFMEGGHFARSLNRMRLAYRQRRGALRRALEAELPPDSYRVRNAHTGLYLLLDLPGRDAAAVAEEARRQGIRVRALAEYGLAAFETSETKKNAPALARDALVVGYGGLETGKAAEAVAALANCLRAG